ncbi:MAG: hypothetical protein ABFD49_07955 [Armatimonadota bacterium]|nr:hypothetical protein [bacterium]
MNRMWQDNRGTTIVEILVVMVVLLVGILTVIQMFPTGFGVVKAAESRTIATRLGQQELERWKAMAANLPSGILPIDDSGDVLNTQYPGYPFAAFTGPDAGPWERGNVLNIRRVVDETTPIPAPGYFQTGSGTTFGSKYALAFGPIDYSESTFAIKSGPLKRVISDGSFIPGLKQGQYAIKYTEDSNEFKVAFPRDSYNIPRIFYVSYSFWAWKDDSSDPVLFSVLDQKIDLTGSSDMLLSNTTYSITVTITVPAGYTHVSIDPQSDTCARGFIPLSPSDSWTSDPYTFKLADPIIGVIAFNPSAQNLYEYTALGKRPIEARIDYRIYDPRIIREDKLVPEVSDSAKEIPIKLALRFILSAGEPDKIGDGDPTDNPDEPTFEGLMRCIDGDKIPQLGTKADDADKDLIISYSMIILDMQTGLRVGVPSSTAGEGVPIDGDDWVDYKTGVVYLPGPMALTADKACLIDYNNNIQVTGVDLRGRNLRFYYRADGDWSVQCHKAYSNYTRVYGMTETDYCHYYLEGNNSTSTYWLFFSPCDAEKTVSVDYTYSGTDGVEHRIVGRAFKISDTSIDDISGNEHYYVDLDLPNSYKITRISVMGISFTARVIWRDGTHWRYVDMDTSMVRD